MVKTPPDWALLFAQVYGIPRDQINRFIDQVQKNAGDWAERLAVEKWRGLGYRVIKRSQKKGFGGYDFYLVNMNPFPLNNTKGLPKNIHIEVKINKSTLTKKQRIVQAEVRENNGKYEIDRYYVDLPLFA